ncbi:TetR/AcrR family transcriptional regulator [Actinomadura rudentiformis]|uniref:TetR/AcrR family transcriptional regulator n=1 Tax=Actinomadura rudentiformis TaxID=359158 RepID=A0A6H9YKY8_9ACTN|nr:TetR/AcrR family transcriptional regulator [Actinomadura rudentiformis]KAB2340989.1 TetR/AcrR family transcriptional regulator [Actinomadura rudentiformis]
MPPEEQEQKQVRHRLLDAAESLLRDRGYESLSIRAVNRAAGMNPAAVHYHFGSKQALVTALLERRLRPVWDGRLADLDKLAGAGTPPAISDLAAFLVEPMARLAADEDERWALALLARLVLTDAALPWRSPWSAPGPWITMIRRARPGLPAEVAAERWRLARDLVLLTYGAPLAEPGERTAPPSPEVVTAFVAAGLAAPHHRAEGNGA